MTFGLAVSEAAVAGDSWAAVVTFEAALAEAVTLADMINDTLGGGGGFTLKRADGTGTYPFKFWDGGGWA